VEAALQGPSGRIVLGPTGLTLGRAQDNQLVVNDSKASSHHAQFRQADVGQSYMITDLGSTNGTFVNEQRLDRNVARLLYSGDRIRIGDMTFIYEESSVSQVAPTAYADSNQQGYQPTVAAPPPQPPYAQPYAPPGIPSYVPPVQAQNKRRRRLWITVGILVTVVVIASFALGAFVLSPRLTTYIGDGYTIGYPQGWNPMKDPKNGSVTFTAAPNSPELDISVSANPNGATSVDLALAAFGFGLGVGSFNKCQLQPVKNFPAHTTVGGDIWSQGAFICTGQNNGQTFHNELAVLVDNHPAHAPTTKLFTIFYLASQQDFDQATSQYFQPMLLSFTFS